MIAEKKVMVMQHPRRILNRFLLCLSCLCVCGCVGVCVCIHRRSWTLIPRFCSKKKQIQPTVDVHGRITSPEGAIYRIVGEYEQGVCGCGCLGVGVCVFLSFPLFFFFLFFFLTRKTFHIVNRRQIKKPLILKP